MPLNEYYSTVTGRRYTLPEKAFAGGGEGSVYEVIGQSELVAKIYPPDKRTSERERKITAMLGTDASLMRNYAWPSDILFGDEGFMGYVMRRVSGTKLIDFYVFDKRIDLSDPKNDLPWPLFISVARNLAAAVHNIHEAGHVIGDLNPNNIICDTENGLVTLVDTDSYHITDSQGNILRCEVGTGEFVPKEMQGIRFADCPISASYNIYTDRFALAVLIFRILMGAHPYVCRSTDGRDTLEYSIEENIKNGVCLYFNKIEGLDIPIYAPDINALPQYLQLLFRRAFLDGTNTPQARPAAEEWYYALSRLYGELAGCGKNGSHFFYRELRECPWCEIREHFKAPRPKPKPVIPPDPEKEKRERKKENEELCRICKKPMPEDAERCPYCGAKRDNRTTYEKIKEKKEKCPICGRAIPEGEKNCPHCSKPKPPKPNTPPTDPNKIKCSVCGRSIPKSMKKCPHCGTPTAQKKKKNRSSLNPVLIIILIMSIIIAGISTFAILADNLSNSSSGAEATQYCKVGFNIQFGNFYGGTITATATGGALLGMDTDENGELICTGETVPSQQMWITSDWSSTVEKTFAESVPIADGTFDVYNPGWNGMWIECCVSDIDEGLTVTFNINAENGVWKYNPDTAAEDFDGWTILIPGVQGHDALVHTRMDVATNQPSKKSFTYTLALTGDELRSALDSGGTEPMVIQEETTA